MKMKKCPACGKTYQEESKFCVCCGSLLTEWTEGEAEQKEEKMIEKEELKRRLTSQNMLYNGRKICEELRKLRLQFAVENKLEYEERECIHQGPSNGTCAYCEQKLDELNDAAQKAGIMDAVVYSYEEINRIIMQNSSPRLMGQMRVEDPPLERERNKAKSGGFFDRLKKNLRK